MGATDDPRSVVDPDCRVIGISGLRVIDASIMPEMPRANTHLTSVMILANTWRHAFSRSAQTASRDQDGSE